jgi:two-component system NtrC family response regulator
MGQILIIDDDRTVAEMLRVMISRMGHRVTCAHSAQEGRLLVQTEPFDVVFLDIQLPDEDGLMALPKIINSPSAPEVIMITGYGSPDGAELAVKSGAWDFIEKPLVKNSVELPLIRALQFRDAKKEGTVPVVLKREGIVGSSAKVESCLQSLAKAAASNANVILFGETGTGKELFANAIHKNSKRAAGSFVVVDCAALPGTLVESVLFGHEKGAFTGADRQRDGLVRQADGGTLFLDEVSELPLAVQRPFLRVLQERRFRPLGSRLEYDSDFRLIAATNRDLESMVKAGLFRDDLFYRLRAITIELPPLREHIEDIQELVFHYMAKICERHGTGVKGFSPEFFEALTAYDWPGNVRELIHALDRSLAMASGESTLFPKHLPTDIRVKLARASIRPAKSDAGDEPSPQRDIESLNEFRRKMEREYLLNLLKRVGGKMEDACRISGLSRSQLYNLLKQHQISRKA